MKKEGEKNAIQRRKNREGGMARKYYLWPYRWISGEPGITFTIPLGYRSWRARSTLFYKPYLGLMTRERDTVARIDSIHKRFVKARYLFHWRTVIPSLWIDPTDRFVYAIISSSVPLPLFSISYYFLIPSSLPYPFIYALEILGRSRSRSKKRKPIRGFDEKFKKKGREISICKY